MNVGPWSEAVLVRLPDKGFIESVATTRSAATLLSNRWPVVKGSAYTFAVQTCADVLIGQSPSYLARRAFVEAAKEIGIAVSY
ncbi:DUF982 domain-containing protein [Sinorhizobium medicae WSM1115]|uniref:DUF982 domain-containing protein n=1 Tax=Sinorhizobium medicae TaxID=110321 RepID=UPI000365D762|nr:DUF982 domain-containing protein [Sinorhizobium medicae]UFX03832.1 DUF982 domain-containing protein [Sinorhizobium medicae WSM1115]